jgi:hypothetical protein
MECIYCTHRPNFGYFSELLSIKEPTHKLCKPDKKIGGLDNVEDDAGSGVHYLRSPTSQINAMVAGTIRGNFRRTTELDGITALTMYSLLKNIIPPRLWERLEHAATSGLPVCLDSESYTLLRATLSSLGLLPDELLHSTLQVFYEEWRTSRQPSEAMLRVMQRHLGTLKIQPKESSWEELSDPLLTRSFPVEMHPPCLPHPGGIAIVLTALRMLRLSEINADVLRHPIAKYVVQDRSRAAPAARTYTSDVFYTMI